MSSVRLMLAAAVVGAAAAAGAHARRRLQAGAHRRPGEVCRRADPGAGVQWAFAAVAAYAVAAAGDTPASWAQAAAEAALGWALAVSVAVDLDVHRIPDRVTRPATVAVAAALSASAACGGPPAGRVAAGAAVLAGAYLVAAVVSGGAGVGLGDAKLAVPVGAALAAHGWWPLAAGGYLAVAVAGGHALWRLASGTATRHTALPHAPALAAAVATLAVAGLAGVTASAGGP